MNTNSPLDHVLNSMAQIAGQALLSMLPYILVMAALLIVMAVLKHKLRKRPVSGPLPYRAANSFLSDAERSFYGVLRSIAGPELVIFCKVRLLDLLAIPAGTPNRQTHLNRVSAKHVDFVLCDSSVLRPLLVIELDDSSHARPDRQRRDAFVDAVCHSASLPILHVPVQRAYAPADLAAQIQTALAGPQSPTTPLASAVER